MNENFNVVSLYACGKSILDGLDNIRVAGLIAMMGIVVPEVTIDGLKYFRIHNDYAHLGLFCMGYVQGIYNGKIVNIPDLYLTPKGIAVMKEVFKFVLAGADHDLVKEIIEKNCSPDIAALVGPCLKLDSTDGKTERQSKVMPDGMTFGKKKVHQPLCCADKTNKDN